MPINSFKRAVVFANGELNRPDVIRKMLRPDDWIIAADGGTLHALACTRTPEIVIGDLDSLPPDLKTDLEAWGTEFVVHPPEKNETDLELALLHVAESDVRSVLVLGALGGRLDQMLANIQLLALPELAGIDIQLADANQTGYIVRDAITIHGSPGDRVSLIPQGGDARGVTTKGLKYPLNNETLYFGRARGISNVMDGQVARVEIAKGILLCVLVDDKFGE
ncbi:MAG: thiamine diphosphokinase [Anaerolineales bacterium]|nr:thiamine diphosphokinase [Anaerolineales bacterium]